VLQVRRNDGPQLETVCGSLDDSVQDDRRWFVHRQSVTHISGSCRRRDFDHTVRRQTRERLAQRWWPSMTTSRELIGANPRPVMGGENAENLPLDRGGHVAFDEGQHRWIKLIKAR
jgi:hypothetical protein